MFLPLILHSHCNVPGTDGLLSLASVHHASGFAKAGLKIAIISFPNSAATVLAGEIVAPLAPAKLLGCDYQNEVY